ncbi:hypothetical protein [Amycolatopsis sp. NPDC004079]|uniref:hypothetical protein n=1 Tax=Amycolatopsis sp. NPDC004079 TaxID=3154549 RepID=UPI00339FE946
MGDEHSTVSALLDLIEPANREFSLIRFYRDLWSPAEWMEYEGVKMTGLMSGLDKGVEPLLARWTDLASDGGEYSYDLSVALGAYRQASAIAAGPFKPAIVQESRYFLTVSEQYLAGATWLCGNPDEVWVVLRKLITAFRRAGDKLSFGNRAMYWSYEAEEVVEELRINATPLLPKWVELTSAYPLQLGVALGAFLEICADRSPATDPLPRTDLGVGMSMRLAQEELAIFSSSRPDKYSTELLDEYEKNAKNSQNAADPGGRVGSRPPGPGFIDDSSPDWGSNRRSITVSDAKEQILSNRAAAFVASFVPEPPGPIPRPYWEQLLSERGLDPGGEQPLAPSRALTPPEANTARADVGSGVPGPYDDLREPWLRRVLRRRRPRR